MLNCICSLAACLPPEKTASRPLTGGGCPAEMPPFAEDGVSGRAEAPACRWDGIFRMPEGATRRRDFIFQQWKPSPPRRAACFRYRDSYPGAKAKLSRNEKQDTNYTTQKAKHTIITHLFYFVLIFILL